MVSRHRAYDAVDGVDAYAIDASTPSTRRRHDAFAFDALTPSSRHNCGDSSRRWKGTVELDFYTVMDYLHDLSCHLFASSK